MGNSIIGAIQQYELDAAVNNLSPGAKEAYDNVSQRGYTPQQVLAYAQDYDTIASPILPISAGGRRSILNAI